MAAAIPIPMATLIAKAIRIVTAVTRAHCLVASVAWAKQANAWAVVVQRRQRLSRPVEHQAAALVADQVRNKAMIKPSRAPVVPAALANFRRKVPKNVPNDWVRSSTNPSADSMRS